MTLLCVGDDGDAQAQPGHAVPSLYHADALGALMIIIIRGQKKLP